MKINANIKEKTWESDNSIVVPYAERNSIYILLSDISELYADKSTLNFGISIIKNGIFYKSEFFPKGLQEYDGSFAQEVVPISIDTGDRIEIYAWLRASEVFFENTFSLDVEESADMVDETGPDPKILAKKDHRKNNFSESRKITEESNKDSSIDKL